MYNAYFGLTENPFNISPDPEFLYRSPQHEEALANLIYGVRSRKGFIVLTGEVGTGKTTMLECLRDYLDSQRIEFAFIFNSRLTPDQFFEMMAYDFDLQCDRKSKTAVLFALNALLDRAGGTGPHLRADRGRSAQSGVGCSRRDPAAGKSGKPAGQAAADYSGRPTGTRPQAGRSESAAAEAAHRAAVHVESADPEESTAYIETRLARAGMPNQKVFLAGDSGRDPQAVARHSALDQSDLRQPAGHCFRHGAAWRPVEMLEEVCQDLRLEWPGNRDRRGRSRYGSGPKDSSRKNRFP